MMRKLKCWNKSLWNRRWSTYEREVFVFKGQWSKHKHVQWASEMSNNMFATQIWKYPPIDAVFIYATRTNKILCGCNVEINFICSNRPDHPGTYERHTRAPARWNLRAGCIYYSVIILLFTTIFFIVFKAYYGDDDTFVRIWVWASECVPWAMTHGPLTLYFFFSNLRVATIRH